MRGVKKGERVGATCPVARASARGERGERKRARKKREAGKETGVIE